MLSLGDLSQQRVKTCEDEDQDKGAMKLEGKHADLAEKSDNGNEAGRKECKACTYGSHCAHTCDKGKKGAPKTMIPKKRNKEKSSNGQDAWQRKQAAMEEKIRREVRVLVI